jgi:hypothetical protein
MKTPEAPSELFRDWQRTQTQSSVTASTARDSKWMSGSAKAGTTAERRIRELRILVSTFLRAPQKRASGELRFLLTIDLHGSRRLGPVLGTGDRLFKMTKCVSRQREAEPFGGDLRSSTSLQSVICFSRDQHSSSSAQQPGLEKRPCRELPCTAGKLDTTVWFRRLETAPGGRWSTGRCIPSLLREPAGPRSTSLAALQTPTPIRPRVP